MHGSFASPPHRAKSGRDGDPGSLRMTACVVGKSGGGGGSGVGGGRGWAGGGGGIEGRGGGGYGRGWNSVHVDGGGDGSGPDGLARGQQTHRPISSRTLGLVKGKVG